MIFAMTLAGCNISSSSSSSKRTSNPTSEPTSEVTSEPTSVPTSEPTSAPTNTTASESTSSPTSKPTSEPTLIPTSIPTSQPTLVPSSAPTSASTSMPTSTPTSTPTSETSETSSSTTAERKTDLYLWHNFGAIYSNSFNSSFVEPLFENDDIKVRAVSKGSYDKLYESITYSLSTRDYPNIATGYASHFANYVRSGYTLENPTGVLQNLNSFLDDGDLNEQHKQETGYTLREDFYPEYMIENNSIAYNAEDNPLTVAIPFSRTTEIMVYNSIFVDYALSKGEIYNIPQTWSEWKLFGPLLRQYQMELNGHKLYGKLNNDGRAYDFSFTQDDGLELLLDFSDVTDEESAVLSWDSGANMFMTLVRQFGSQFTSFTFEDRKASKVEDRHGYMEFYSDDNKDKTIAAMQLVRDLTGNSNETRIFAVPSYFGGRYASSAFQDNKVLFSICSSGGLLYSATGDKQIRVAPIPYNTADYKYVVSEGANMTVFDQNNYDNKETYNKEQTVKLAFDTVIKMSTGEYQAKWAVATGYYPTSKSATSSQAYQQFLVSPSSDPGEQILKDSARLNQEIYMNESVRWMKFIDTPFIGSETIRLKADNIISDVINSMGDKTIEQVLEGVYNDPQLTKYVRK